MSRADSYGAYYRDFRAQLLHQTYAYCGNTEVAQRSVSDAFVSAGHHWRKLEDSHDRDAWMREQAFRATGRAQNRARKPWYVSAKSTADNHRPLLGVLARLAPTDRRLVILAYLVGLDLASAGREAGVTDSAARTSLEGSLGKLAVAGIDTTWAGLHAALDVLRVDLADEPVDRASRLRREGNRRRRSHLLLAGVSVLALAVGAGALTAAQSPAQSSGDELPPPSPATPTAPAQETFTADLLATDADVRILDRQAHWSTLITSSDFGDDQPVSECIAGPPSEKRADHYWVRRFSAGRGADAAQASQALEVATSADVAKATYQQLVGALSVCHGASRQLLDYRKVSGIGDQAGVFAFQYVDGNQLREEMTLLARTGKVVQTWLIRPQAGSVRSRLLLKLAGVSVDAVCADAEGACATRPYEAVVELPAPDDSADGFLETVDLPVFAGIEPAWAATPITTVTKNMSLTPCDDANFSREGATRVTSRTYVVPGSKELPPVFGMSETIGAFASVNAARAFMSTVYGNVRKCEDRQLNLKVKRESKVHVGSANGRVWQIESAASETTSFEYRVCLLRVGDTVAEATFTPSDPYDVDQAQYVRLAKRAGQRLAQAQSG
jgi:DNA-directed RNA polymerase specialized sigma24 family protein